MTVKTVSILGSTGSIGQSTIKVLQAQETEYSVQAITAHKNWELLAEQAISLKAKRAVIADESYHENLKQALAGTDIETAAGEEALDEAARMPADWIMAAIVGMAGLKPLMAAIEQGGIVAIANKEPLVAAGELVLSTAQKSGTTILPVDSEHNAVFQVFENDNKDNIERIILTASGGPLRTLPLEKMKNVTVEQALAHPNWSMGNKISIDSATMMNKALEIIEARLLFGMKPEQIDVMVHPQSVIHSMVEYSDGSILAQMGASDMSTPITNALGHPKRLKTPGQKLDFTQIKHLDFEAVDEERFPSIRLAYDCLNQGQEACIALNAANEVAVNAFLNHKIAFLDIYKTVLEMVNTRPSEKINSLENILTYDKSIRIMTESYIVSKDSQCAKTATQ